MDWIEFSVEIDQEAVESVSELFAEVGYNQGVAVDQPFIGSPDGPEYVHNTAVPVVVRTYVPDDEHAETARLHAEQGLWAMSMLRPVGVLQVRRLAEEDWANAWKVHYPIRRIGQHWVVVPSWLEYAPEPDDLVLQLDPGMAFGTGLHPTTQLCLVLLERYVQPAQRTLDLGCGSGILALALAKAGATVLAVDNDPVAVQATRENVARNGVTELVTTLEGSLGPGLSVGHWLGSDWGNKVRAAYVAQTNGPVALAPHAEIDLLAANILANVHVLLAPAMAEALKPGGVLVTSGIIADREAEVVRAFEEAGLVPLERLQEGDWVALAHRRA